MGCASRRQGGRVGEAGVKATARPMGLTRPEDSLGTIGRAVIERKQVAGLLLKQSCHLANLRRVPVG
jgi:hypothetical protein